MKRYKEEFEQYFRRVLERYQAPHEIAEGMRYACLQGGKRLRPSLLLACLDLLGEDRELGLPFAAALEMIHSYSLVHDDLPVMDNDDFRRGQPTTHKKFGEANAILIGDALLSNAFALMIRESQGKIEAKTVLEIVALYSEYSGIDGMIGGQAVDIASEGKKISLESLEYIHRHKTGKLLLLPIQVACLLAKASLEQEKALLAFGEDLGLSFQIKDDILDEEGSFEELGKPVGSDKKLNKSTYPSLLGLEESKKRLHESLERAKKAILSVFSEEKATVFMELLDCMETRKN